MANNILDSLNGGGTNDLVKNILTQRFEPTFQDVGNAALAGVAGNTYVSPQSAGDSRMKAALQTLALVNATQRTNIMSAGGQTGALIDRFMAANPNATLSDAMSFVKSPGQGNTYGPTGVTVLPGAAPAATTMANAKESGDQAAKLAYAGPIEAAKKQGQGEITDVKKKELGQSQLGIALDTLRADINDLNSSGGIVNPENSAAANVLASVKQSAPGQFVQGMVGTKEQSVRNKIKSLEPVIINSIRQATGMSAKAMDSNAELLFYRAAIKANDLPSQLAAIDNIIKIYGGGAINPITPNDAGGAALPDGIDENDIAEYKRLKGIQ